MRRIRSVPVVDVFAGPGGLSEGFSAFQVNDAAPFRVALSIEKDPVACRTLQLRKFVLAFETPPDGYYAFTRGEITLEQLYAAHPLEASAARDKVWEAELGVVPAEVVARRVQGAIAETGSPWVLIGGPPCQAYSLVGRARMRTTNADFEKDKRHLLYREYLQIVARHQPAVFVMENVRGILSSTLGGTGIFERIVTDLRRPSVALGITKNRGLSYRLYGFGPGAGGEYQDTSDPADHFLIRAEDYGVPQARHRIFIVGVRSDIEGSPEPLDPKMNRISVGDALAGLPVLRSRLSRRPDSCEEWIRAVREVRSADWMDCGRASPLHAVAARVESALKLMSRTGTTGGPFLRFRAGNRTALGSWYRRDAIDLTHHESRSHMKEDLHRYLFAASFASVTGRSPSLREFPIELRPRHSNVEEAVGGGMFGDRFRVQQHDRPGSTVTSHISKDGNYYIHYAPEQCRSLTVREAARIQTFPDAYYFYGNRTQQFHQVGNAVPPLLAHEVARSIHGLVRSVRRAAA